VTALYEVKPRDGRGTGNAPWLTLNLRYVDAGSGAVKTLAAQLSRVAPSFEQASQDFRFIASVAAFGFMLKGTPMERAIAPDELTRWARTSVQGRPEREQFLGLVEMARAL
jgi:Ca-activated chloride channel homolog